MIAKDNNLTQTTIVLVLTPAKRSSEKRQVNLALHLLNKISSRTKQIKHDQTQYRSIKGRDWPSMSGMSAKSKLLTWHGLLVEIRSHADNIPAKMN